MIVVVGVKPGPLWAHDPTVHITLLIIHVSILAILLHADAAQLQFLGTTSQGD